LNGIEHVNGNIARFRLTASMSEKIARRVKKGQSVKTAFKSLAVVKPIKMAQKERKDKKAAKLKSPKKSTTKPKKQSAKKDNKAKKEKSEKKSTKQKM